jgi:hypothetical protein
MQNQLLETGREGLVSGAEKNRCTRLKPDAGAKAGPLQLQRQLRV